MAFHDLCCLTDLVLRFVNVINSFCFYVLFWVGGTGKLIALVRLIRQQRSNKVRQGGQDTMGSSTVHTWATKKANFSVTILPVFGGKRDSENLVGSAHKQPWWPPAANMCPL